jgi:tetratricopeptide (TPR) repeat protein
MKSEIHKLLYRLAEIMLQQEQHVLPVDLLFDDEQIGDFVKSIQIDSPYQQLLLEGVLTESVREEKLYVSFTVEGYFHYVLGEVIFHQTEGKGAEALKQIVEQNKLNGTKEGVEQCLIKLIGINQYQVLFNLIDLGGIVLKNCVVPLAAILLKEGSKYTKTESKFEIEENYLKNVLQLLIDDSTENDFIVLFDTIHYLKQIQKNKLLKTIYDSIIDFENYNSVTFTEILIIGIPFVNQNQKINLLGRLENEIEKFNTLPEYPAIVHELATQYLILSDFEKAKELFEKALKIFESKEGLFLDEIEKTYTNLGAIYWYSEDLAKTRKYYELAYRHCIKSFGENHPQTALGIHNLALIKVLEEDFDESILLFNKSLNIILKNDGNSHPNTARAYSNIGSAYLKKGEYKIAFGLFNQALLIDKQVFDEYHPNLGYDYDDIGDIYFYENNFTEAKKYYNKSKLIFLSNYGIEFDHIKLLDEKIALTNTN